MKIEPLLRPVARTLLCVFSIVLLSMNAVYAEGTSSDQIAVLLADSSRSDEDKARDSARKPAEVIAFSGIEPGMTVLDVMAASGWYTEVLSSVVGPNGIVIAQNPAFMLEFMDGMNDKLLSARLADDRLPNVRRVDAALADADIPAGSVDVAFTALNFHDTYYMAGEDAALALLNSINDSLKPGGVFILIDHNGNIGMDNEKLHRIPQDIVVDIAAVAGFTLEAEGEMLAHPEDDGSAMVFAKDIRGKTDRFVLRLRKSS